MRKMINGYKDVWQMIRSEISNQDACKLKTLPIALKIKLDFLLQPTRRIVSGLAHHCPCLLLLPLLTIRLQLRGPPFFPGACPRSSSPWSEHGHVACPSFQELSTLFHGLPVLLQGSSSNTTSWEAIQCPAYLATFTSTLPLPLDHIHFPLCVCAYFTYLCPIH